MTAAEITFAIVILSVMVCIYFTYKVLKEFNKMEDEDDEIWS